MARTFSRSIYLDWLLASTPDEVRRWVPEERLRLDLAEHFDCTWKQRVEDHSWLTGWAKACPVDGVGPEDYRLREVNVSPTAAVLAGIHFRNRDTRQPFVGVFAQTRDLTDRELSAATRSLIGEFGQFRPSGVQWWSPTQRDLRHLPAATGEYRLVIGPIAQIVRGSSSLPAQYTFSRERVAQFYDDYRHAYDEFRAHASFDNVPKPEARESLAACEHEGELYCLRESDRFAGLMAARPEMVRGIAGWLVVEEILGADHRGMGLAVPMQRLFASKFDPTRGALVMGEIADGNVPSLRTAQRAGRTDVGGYVLIQA